MYRETEETFDVPFDRARGSTTTVVLKKGKAVRRLEKVRLHTPPRWMVVPFYEPKVTPVTSTLRPSVLTHESFSWSTVHSVSNRLTHRPWSSLRIPVVEGLRKLWIQFPSELTPQYRRTTYQLQSTQLWLFRFSFVCLFIQCYPKNNP